MPESGARSVPLPLQRHTSATTSCLCDNPYLCDHSLSLWHPLPLQRHTSATTPCLCDHPYLCDHSPSLRPLHISAISLPKSRNRLTNERGERNTAYWRKAQQKCGGAHLFESFTGTPLCLSVCLSLSQVRPAWPSQWARVHREEMILTCGIKLAVWRAVCLFCACWLAIPGVSVKSRWHVNLGNDHTLLRERRCFVYSKPRRRRRETRR